MRALSDAIALALRMDSTIFVEQKVLDISSSTKLTEVDFEDEKDEKNHYRGLARSNRLNLHSSSSFYTLHKQIKYILE